MIEDLLRDKKRLVIDTVVSIVSAVIFTVPGFVLTNGHPLQNFCAFVCGWLGLFTPIFVISYLRVCSSEVIPKPDKARFDEGYNLLSSRLHASIGLIVSEGFFLYYNRFAEWRSKATGGTARRLPHRLYEQAGWTTFADAYLNDEADKIGNQYVDTNSKVFTSIYWHATTQLTGSKFAGLPGSRASDINKRVLRWHITGMLPEEFYNGLQIVNVSTDSKPIFFSHQWEEYDQFYMSSDADWEGVTVKRCTLVKEAGIRKPVLSAFSTIEDLYIQSHLYMFEASESVNNELASDCQGVIDRLFQKNSLPGDMGTTDMINSILGRANFNYWPIVNPSTCNGARIQCRSVREWKPLLSVYMQQFCRSQETSFYSIIGEPQWEAIYRNESLRSCFKEGWTPEIVLFGDINEKQWYFGYLGHYRPYSKDIELRFLTSVQTAELFAAFKDILLVPNGKPPLQLSNLPRANHAPPGYDFYQPTNRP